MKVKLTLPLPISINKLYIPRYGWNPKTKQRIPTGGLIMSKEGEEIKNKIRKIAKKQIDTQIWDFNKTKSCYIYMDIVFFWNRAGRDDNNAFKLLNDSLEGIIYHNDSRILTRTQRMLIDPNNPRVELTFSFTAHRGIFDNQEHLDEFESNCMTCNRYKRNCSILRKAKEGRIQEEIDKDFVCSKYKKIKK